MGEANDMAAGQTGILHEIVILILPAYPDLDDATRRPIEREVTGYVAMQIAAMPSFLRLPYRLALFGFAWLPLFRYGRRFQALPGPRKVSYLAAWNEARFSPMRDVVKLIRSTALLVYFDHPIVRTRLDEAGSRVALGAPEKAANA